MEFTKEQIEGAFKVREAALTVIAWPLVQQYAKEQGVTAKGSPSFHLRQLNAKAKMDNLPAMLRQTVVSLGDRKDKRDQVHLPGCLNLRDTLSLMLRTAVRIEARSEDGRGLAPRLQALGFEKKDTTKKTADALDAIAAEVEKAMGSKWVPLRNRAARDKKNEPRITIEVNGSKVTCTVKEAQSLYNQNGRPLHVALPDGFEFPEKDTTEAPARKAA